MRRVLGVKGRYLAIARQVLSVNACVVWKLTSGANGALSNSRCGLS